MIFPILRLPVPSGRSPAFPPLARLNPRGGMGMGQQKTGWGSRDGEVSRGLGRVSLLSSLWLLSASHLLGREKPTRIWSGVLTRPGFRMGS